MNVELNHVKTEYQLIINYTAYWRKANPFCDSDRELLFCRRVKTFDEFPYDVNKKLSEQIIPYLEASVRSEDATEITFYEAEVYEINTYKTPSNNFYYNRIRYAAMDQKEIAEVIRYAPKGRR